MTRRTWLGAASAGLAARATTLRADFTVAEHETCLNNARWHPMSEQSRKAVLEYLDYKTRGGLDIPDYSARQQRAVKETFAKLINARPDEIAFTPSTMAGENAIAHALQLDGRGGVVTDALHFEGSLYLYGELANGGMPLKIVRPRAWRIDLEDMERAIGPGTKLVAVSAVAMMTGFAHNLKALCDLAHSKGALVYADIIQAAGAVPIDVRASGVDFAACSSYKWLMGDMGLGFLYVRQELLERLRRPHYGYRQLTRMDYHLFPHDPPGQEVFEWTAASSAGGHFEIGTVSNTTVAALSASLPLLLNGGVQKTVDHRRPLLAKLRREMPRLGFEALTPEGDSPIVTFTKKDAGQLAARLRAAKVDVSVAPHRLRISPSIYNTDRDIDRLLEAIS